MKSGNYKVMHGIKNAAQPPEIDLFSVEAVAATRDDWPLEPLHRWFQNLNTPADLTLVS